MEILFWCLLPIFSGLWLTSSSELKNVKRKLKRLERNKNRSSSVKFLERMAG